MNETTEGELSVEKVKEIADHNLAEELMVFDQSLKKRNGQNNIRT